MENEAEFFYEKLKTTTNPGPILASFLCSLYELEVSRSEIMMCNKFVKIFGKFTTFFAIMDMAGSMQRKPDEIYPYLFTICKRRFESAHPDAVLQSHTSLDSYLKTMEKEIQQVSKKKIKIPPSEGLDTNDTD